MSKANQHSTILLSIAGFAVIIAVVVVVGLFQSSGDKDVIQGQVEVTEREFDVRKVFKKL